MGHRQAQIVAQHLAEKLKNEQECVRLYCSPMWRALKTADYIGQALDLRSELWVDLHEIGGIYLDHGEEDGLVGYPGKTRQDILSEFPKAVLPAEITDEGWWTGGYEDWSACHGRASRVAHALHQRASQNELLLLVSHGGFIDSLLKALMNQLPGRHFFYHQYNTAISRISFREDGRLEIHFLNSVNHLPQDLVS
jgi:broad specificity phosphatase PhoE